MKIQNLKKEYKTAAGNVVALNGVSFDLPDKGMVFILGKSGSGKSTLLNVLSGMDTFDEGDIFVDDKNLAKMSLKELDNYRNTCCGFVFQEYHLIAELSVRDNILLSLNLKGEKKGDEELNRVLDEVELSGYENRSVTELSGGQKQRVAIARAIVKDPEIVFADEPTGALDNKTGESILQLLKKLSLDRLVVVVTHDREFAEKYGDRIIEIADGKVIRDTDPDFSSREQNKSDWKSSKMPLKAALRMGCGNFKYHPIRLAVTIFLCVLSFSLLGLSLTISWNTFDNMVLKSMRTVHLSQSFLGKYRESRSLPFKIQEAEKIKGEIQSPLLPVVYDEISFPIEDEEELFLYYMVLPNGYTQISKEELEAAGFSYEGNLPASKEELAITKFSAEIFSAWKIPANVNDKILLGEKEFTISAIIDTKFQTDIYAPLKSQTTEDELFTRYIGEFSQSLHNLIFVNDLSPYVHDTVDFPNGRIQYEQAPTLKVRKFKKIGEQTRYPLSEKEGVYASKVWLSILLRATACNLTYQEKSYWNYSDLLEALNDGKQDYFETYLSSLDEFEFPREFSGTFQDPLSGYSFDLTIVGFHDGGSEEVLIPNTLFDSLYQEFGGEYDGAIVIGNGNSLKAFVSETGTFRLNNSVIQNVIEAMDILEPIRSICNILSIILVVFAVILFMNFIMQSLTDKTQIIGILKALGCKNTGLMKIFVWEGLIIGMIVMGIVVLILGVLSAVLNAILFAELQSGYVYLFGLSAPVLLLLFGIIVAFSLLGSILPILRLSRLLPNQYISNA